MKVSISYSFLLLCTTSVLGQVGPPKSLSAILATLPDLVASGAFDSKMASFSDSVDDAIERGPAEIEDALAVCSDNLRASNQLVKAETLILIASMAHSDGGAILVAKLAQDIAAALQSGDDTTKRAAIYALEAIGPSGPDSLLSPLEKVVAEHKETDRIVIGAAKTLILMRHADTTAQSTIIALINNEGVNESVRADVLVGTAQNMAQPSIFSEMLVQNACLLVKNSQDKVLRDAAVVAVGQMGPLAVQRVETRLRSIAQDSSESDGSRKLSSTVLASAIAQAADSSPSPSPSVK